MIGPLRCPKSRMSLNKAAHDLTVHQILENFWILDEAAHWKWNVVLVWKVDWPLFILLIILEKDLHSLKTKVRDVWRQTVSKSKLNMVQQKTRLEHWSNFHQIARKKSPTIVISMDWVVLAPGSIEMGLPIHIGMEIEIQALFNFYQPHCHLVLMIFLRCKILYVVNKNSRDFLKSPNVHNTIVVIRFKAPLE